MKNEELKPLWLSGGTEVWDSQSLTVLQKARLNWKVELQPIECGGVVREEWKGIIRSKDNAMLGLVKEGSLMQNSEAFEFFDVATVKGKADYVAAGECGGGKVVWIMSKLNIQPKKVGGENIEMNCLLSNASDGKAGRRIELIPYRTIAKSTGSIPTRLNCLPLRLCHTRDFDFNVDAFMREASLKLDVIVADYNKMTKIKVDDKWVEEYFMKAIYPSKSPGYMRRASDLMTMYESGPGAGIKEAQGTLWGAYGAILGWVDHLRSGAPAAQRLEAAWFYQGKLVKERALALALKKLK